MIRIERLRADGSRERADLVATECGMVYIFPAHVPVATRRTGRGWYQYRVGYIVFEVDLSWTVRNIGNRIVHDLIEDRLDALATVASSEGYRITALGPPDRLVDMKLPVTLERHDRPRQYATLSTTMGKVYLFPERVPARQRRIKAGCGELLLGTVRRTSLGWDIELESGERGHTLHESRVDAVHQLVRLSPLTIHSVAGLDEPGDLVGTEAEAGDEEFAHEPVTPRIRPAASGRTPSQHDRPLQSMYA